MKILLISTAALPVPCPNYGGLEQVLFDLAVELRSMGHKVSVLAVAGSNLPDDIEFINGGIPGQTDEAKMYSLAAERIDKGEFDIIHDHSWTKQIYLHKARNDKIKFISTLHGMCNYSSPPPVKYANLVCLSRDHAVRTAQTLNINTRWCFNGIDTNLYKFQAKKGRRYLWLGRYMPGKGAHIAIEIARRLNIELDLVGDTKMVLEQDYIKKVREQCDGVQIKFHEAQPRAKCAEFFGNACALLQCGNGTWAEPFGLITLESFACGTPVIALRNGATVELIEPWNNKHPDNKVGILCNDIEAMAKAINSEELLDIKPEDCRARAEALNRRAMAKNYRTLYGDVLAGNEW